MLTALSSCRISVMPDDASSFFRPSRAIPRAPQTGTGLAVNAGRILSGTVTVPGELSSMSRIRFAFSAIFIPLKLRPTHRMSLPASESARPMHSDQ